MANWKEVTERWLPIVEKMEEHGMDDYAIPEIYRAAERAINEADNENEGLREEANYMEITIGELRDRIERLKATHKGD